MQLRWSLTLDTHCEVGEANLADVVLPVPGGPSNKTALGLLLAYVRRVPCAILSYTSGCRRASSIVSSIACFWLVYPARQRISGNYITVAHWEQCHEKLHLYMLVNKSG